MIKTIIDDSIIANTCVSEEKLSMYYDLAGYDIEDELTWEQFFTSPVGMRKKIWYFIHFGELSGPQLETISADLKLIVAPILEENYSGIQLTDEIAEGIRSGEDEIAYQCARAQLNTIPEHVIMSVAYCITMNPNTTYRDNVRDYLINFANNN